MAFDSSRLTLILSVKTILSLSSSLRVPNHIFMQFFSTYKYKRILPGTRCNVRGENLLHVAK